MTYRDRHSLRRVFRLPTTRARLAREIDDELAFHIEKRLAALVATGLSPDDARREAYRQFGDVNGVRESCLSMDEQRERGTRRASMFDDVRQDLVYAARTLRRNLGATSIIVGALAIGIGANTAIFTLIDAVLVRRLPVPHPEQLVVVGDPSLTNSIGAGTPSAQLLSAPLYRDVRDGNRVFSGVAASGRAGRLDARIERDADEFEHPTGRFVSANYFSVLGVRAFAGRTFEPIADSVVGASPVVTISNGYWTRRFHNDPSAIGRVILIGGVRFTIVGVAPPSFTGEVVGESPDIWLPIEMHDVMRPHEPMLNDRKLSWLLLVGRLEPGATLARAQREVGPLITRSILGNATPKTAKAFLQRRQQTFISSGARGLSEVRDIFEAPLLTLMIGVALLMCIICANVANLLLSRAIARGREMAVRLALGAHRARLVRQLLTESAALAVLSAGIGLLVAWLGSRALVAMASDGTPMALDVGMDATILAFTLGVSVLAVGLFGLVPALHASRVDLASTFRATAGQGRTRPPGRLLIVGQVALSVVLLVGASMLVRSLRNVEAVDPGLDRDHLVVADVDILSRGYAGEPLAHIAHTLRDRIAALPGVVAVTYSENGIFSGTDWHSSVGVPGFSARTPEDSSVGTDAVGPRYAQAIGARILAGRDFAASDEGKPGRVALVNQSLASFYFPYESAVGKFVYLEDSLAMQIVGVIADTRDHSLTSESGRRLYYPYAHSDTGNKQLGNPGALRLEVRTVGDPAATIQAIRRAIVSVDPSLPIENIAALTTLMRQSISDERLVSRLAAAFGALALALAAIGLYGVMNYAVTRRTGEMGVRVALGAQRRDIIGLILSAAVRLVAAGLLVGLPLAIGLTKLLGAQLHGIGAVDPKSVATAVVVLALSTLVAVLVPALRASNTSPMEALRDA